jgi:hypothetical protein
MNERNFAQSAFFGLSALIGLVELLAGAFLALLGVSAFSEVSGAPPLRRPIPQIVKVTQITGAEGTGRCGGGYDLGVGLVDLDHGLAAGATTYDHGGFFWCETYAPYLWSEQGGTSTLFELQGEFNWENNTYIPNAMIPDGSTVVGGVIFLTGEQTRHGCGRPMGGPWSFSCYPRAMAEGTQSLSPTMDG